MNEDFTFDYLLTRFSAIERQLDAMREIATKIFNAIIRIEYQIKENTADLREVE
jgi:hypothetical protein